MNLYSAILQCTIIKPWDKRKKITPSVMQDTSSLEVEIVEKSRKLSATLISCKCPKNTLRTCKCSNRNASKPYIDEETTFIGIEINT